MKVEKVKVKVLKIDYARKRVLAKLPKQRKPDSFLVMVTDKGNIIAQGSRSICIIDPVTGREIWAGVILSLEDAAKVLDEEIERYGTELGVCHA